MGRPTPASATGVATNQSRTNGLGLASNSTMFYSSPETSIDAGVAPSARELSRRVAEAARALGFSRVGFARAEPLSEGKVRLEEFLAAGHAGTMSYLAEGPRHDPRELLPEAKSVIAVALAYGDRSLTPRRPLTGLVGRVARYARGTDYHLVLKERLAALAERLPEITGGPVKSRACVDTAPLLERELAARAGLGFHGKSTLVIAPGAGSYVLLGELLVDVELEPSEPTFAHQGCGSCRACLDACPTAAFVEPHRLDARRCISFLTIESPDNVPRELRSAIGNRVFGCDVCQEACPYNQGRSARVGSDELAPRAELDELDLVALLELGAAGYRKLVRRSALRRTPRTTLQRNAAIALGNSDDPRAVAPLARALEQNPSALVRRHAAWALGELGRHADPNSRRALRRALDFDPDPDVRAEARTALARATSS
jgi:epoxyqueuosine reductase